jgi:phosphoribosylaminoimidazolecarboxamide formyltransferase/IMP cyclohydrolase
LPVKNISDVTGFAECLDGRLKTLHPAIHGGILALRDNETHLKQIDDLHIFPIDIVAVNLYPFKQTIRAEQVHWPDAVENIDIGGPAMLRAAAKNYRFVTALTDPADYTKVIDELKAMGQVSEETNLHMAAKVFMHTADYDAAIAAYWKEKAKLSPLPQTLTLTYEKAQDLRYGENPHQRAAFYK